MINENNRPPLRQEISEGFVSLFMGLSDMDQRKILKEMLRRINETDLLGVTHEIFKLENRSRPSS